MSELGDTYDYGDNYLDQDDLSDGGSETADTKVGADKRAHHNALERKRRDHIKDSFSSLRDSIPLLHGEKVNSHKASRAQILKKAAEYIDHMRKKNTDHKKDVELLRKENKYLEEKIRELEALKAANGKAVVNTSSSTSVSSKTNPTTSSNNQPQCSAPSSSSSTSTSTSFVATSSSPSVTVQTVIPAQVKVVTANGISKPIQLQGTLRMRRTSIGEPNGSGGISLLNNSHVRVKSESSSCTSDANNSEYSELKEPQVQILKSDHKVTTNTASGLIVTNRNGTTLLQQPIITLAAKPLVFKQQTPTVTALATTVTSVTSQANSTSSGNKNSLLGPPAKRKRIGESGVTIIAANVGQLLNK